MIDVRAQATHTSSDRAPSVYDTPRPDSGMIWVGEWDYQELDGLIDGRGTRVTARRVRFFSRDS